MFVIMWGRNRVGLKMMKNGQTVKGHDEEFGYYPGNMDNPVRVLLCFLLTLVRRNLHTVKCAHFTCAVQ